MLWHFHLIAESHVQHMDPLGPHFSQIETTDAPLGMYPRISLLLMCTFCDAYHYFTLLISLGPTHFCRIRNAQATIDMCFFCGKDFCAPRGLGSCKVPMTAISIRNLGLGGSTMFFHTWSCSFFYPSFRSSIRMPFICHSSSHPHLARETRMLSSLERLFPRMACACGHRRCAMVVVVSCGSDEKP